MTDDFCRPIADTPEARAKAHETRATQCEGWADKADTPILRVYYEEVATLHRARALEERLRLARAH